MKHLKKIVGALVIIGLLVVTAKVYAERTTPSVFTDAPTGIDAQFTDLDCTANGLLVQITGDTDRICQDFEAVEDAAGVIDVGVDTLQGDSYFRLRPGSAGTTVAAGDGIGITFGTAFLKTATNTPTMDVIARQAVVENATSTFSFIGFADTTGASADYAAQPNGCMFVASSTAANWIAVCKNGANYSQTNTGIATSSVVSGTGSFYRFRVSLSAQTASFYIQSTSTAMATVATITGMSVASTTALNPVVSTGRATTAGLANELHVRVLKMTYLDPLW